MENKILFTTGPPTNKSTREFNYRELKAAASVFAVAIEKGETLQELQELADKLSRNKALATEPRAAVALQTLQYCLRSGRLNTARCLVVAEQERKSSSRRIMAYDIDFQLLCLEQAILFEAPAIIKGVVHEIEREAYFTGLTVPQFRRALDIGGGYLDKFIVLWASALDRSQNFNTRKKKRCLQQALSEVSKLREILNNHIHDDPVFATDPGNATGKSPPYHSIVRLPR